MDPIRVILVDDHDVLRQGLISLLQEYEDIEVVADASNGEEAIQLIREICPDLAVMDIAMPKMDGIEATRRLRDQCPQCRVLALTVHEDKQYFFEMLSAGASGYLTKRAAADELISAIRAVAGGNVYLQPVLARWLLDDYQRFVDLTNASSGDTSLSEPGRTVEGIGLGNLSDRERQVIELVAAGLTSQEIGKHLGISPKTVSRHRERIMHKLNLNSSVDLVKFALRTGLTHL